MKKNWISFRSRINKKSISAVIFLICLSFIVVSCVHDDCETNPKISARIYIDEGVDEVIFEVLNERDNTILPVLVAFPPDQSAPYKGAVVMHGSGGLWKTNDNQECNVGELSGQFEEWRELLLSQGFFVAFPDSYSSRGTCKNEGDFKKPPKKFTISATFIRNSDANAVLEMLSNLYLKNSEAPLIDTENVALLGFSDGGSAVLSTLFNSDSIPEDWIWTQSFEGKEYINEILPPLQKVENLSFKVGVAYYPGAYHNGYYGRLCNEGEGIYKSSCDILFHIAEEDPLADNTECLLKTMEFNKGGVASIHKYVTGHGFDNTDGIHSELARQRTLNYLKKYLMNN